MILECRNLNYKYPDTENYVLKNISCKLMSPGFHALFGPSGVGKTSLAKIVTGEINCFSGDLIRNKQHIFLYTYNQERFPGWDTVSHFLDLITPSGHKDFKDKLIDIFDVNDCIDLKFSQLSLGQQNRVNLIRYLLQHFDLLIMDESLSNVDERLREKIILNIKELFPEKYFIYISHNLIEVTKFCRTVLILRHNGKMPQIITLNGLNINNGDTVSNVRFEPVILEIMNAC